MKKLFGYIPFRIWAIVAPILIAILLVVTILAETILFSFMSSIFGNRKNARGEGAYFYSDYETKEKALAAANALNEEINEEGIVLLKNEKNALPISKTAKISVFGKNSVNLVYAGTGSSGGNSDSAVKLYDALTEAGFSVNPTLKAFYESNSQSGEGRGPNPGMEDGSGAFAGRATGETPQSSYTDAVKQSYTQYNDAALVIVSRIGGEGFDLPMSMSTGWGSSTGVEGAYSAYDHYLELDKNEQDLLREVCENFKKVILVVNSSTTMELGFLDTLPDGDETALDYDFASGIDAALWIGGPGNTGINALAKVLNGDVNPSGRTVDLYARDFTAIPSTKNFSTNKTADGDAYTLNGSSCSAWFVDYEEGIYVGYKYFETRGFTDGEEWYNKNVVYPFGYGKSYTNFEWTLKNSSPAKNSVFTANTRISVTVEVKNTGNRAGKDVVQVYVTAPYYAGGVEKSHVSLMGFAKTKLIEPGDTDEVTVTFDSYDMASYDYANRSGVLPADVSGGYVLESGNYQIKVMKNSHEVVDSVDYSVADGGIAFNTDKVDNRFDNADDDLVNGVLSRNDWEGTFPATRTAQERETTQARLNEINSTASGNPLETNSSLATMPTQEQIALPECEIQLYDLMHIVNETVEVRYDDEKWDAILNQLTVTQMFNLLKADAFNTPGIATISKPITLEADGPAGFTAFMGDPTVNGTCAYASECVIGATWNVELAHRMGVMIGNEGIIGDSQNKGSGNVYSGWYAPAINIHRTPFSGRNFEYYSEDGVLNGKMAASVVAGARSKGIYTFVKHFAVNDQETHRNGVCTWLDEQTLREIYLKPFEITVKEGKTSAMMSSFNRIGARWAGGDYRLLTEVLRDEWGFNGTVICDFNKPYAYMDVKQMVYAGGDINLATVSASNWYSASNAADVTVIRKAAKNLLYTVAGSCAMNGLGEGIKLSIKLADWEVFIIILDCVAAVAIVTWGGFVTIKALKKKKEQSGN